MRVLVLAVTFLLACGRGPISSLPLQWRGVSSSPRPSPAVAEALSTVPFAFGLRDVRPDPSVVGMEEGSGTVIRTPDNVGEYCASRLGDMFRSAGAHLDAPPMAMVETDLLEYRVIEGGTFAGLVRLRVTVRRGDGPGWTKVFEGTSRRWGRSHSPVNYNEALSNALAEAAEKLVRDDGFAYALMSSPEQPAPPPPGE